MTQPNASVTRISIPRLTATPDPILLDAAAGGEKLVAELRLLLIGTLLPIPFMRVQSGVAQREEGMIEIGFLAFTLLLSFLVYSVVRRGFYRNWLGFATSAMDVTLVTGLLFCYLLADLPVMAINSSSVFDVYFLAIAATSFRYDTRFCLWAAFLAAIEYGFIIWLAVAIWGLTPIGPLTLPYGPLDWPTQMGRIIMLLAVGVLSMIIVSRSQAIWRLSSTDRLTGLPNRGTFDERLDSEISRSRRHDHPLTVVMLDIDHFKRFNDTYGHSAGDEVLRSLGALLRAAVRRSDIAARYGGEEFALILPETPARAALEKVEAIRMQVAEKVLALPGRGVSATLTVSAGVANYPADTTEIHELLELADARLLHAKQTGRNRVIGPDFQRESVSRATSSENPA